MIKKTLKIENKGKFPLPDKEYLQKPTANIILDSEKMEAFP